MHSLKWTIVVVYFIISRASRLTHRLWINLYEIFSNSITFDTNVLRMFPTTNTMAIFNDNAFDWIVELPVSNCIHELRSRIDRRKIRIIIYASRSIPNNDSIVTKRTKLPDSGIIECWENIEPNEQDDEMRKTIVVYRIQLLLLCINCNKTLATTVKCLFVWANICCTFANKIVLYLGPFLRLFPSFFFCFALFLRCLRCNNTLRACFYRVQHTRKTNKINWSALLELRFNVNLFFFLFALKNVVVVLMFWFLVESAYESVYEQWTHSWYDAMIQVLCQFIIVNAI